LQKDAAVEKLAAFLELESAVRKNIIDALCRFLPDLYSR
jgi:hypothetical protein